MPLSNDIQKAERAVTVLKALREYKDDLDQAIAAFSVYAATHERRGIVALPVNREKILSGRSCKN